MFLELVGQKISGISETSLKRVMGFCTSRPGGTTYNGSTESHENIVSTFMASPNHEAAAVTSTDRFRGARANIHSAGLSWHTNNPVLRVAGLVEFWKCRSGRSGLEQVAVASFTLGPHINDAWKESLPRLPL